MSNYHCTDQCADLVSCAQSFHWFANLQSLKEIHRILKPQGHLLLIWNQRDISVNWVNALAQMILPFEGDTPRFHNQDWRQVFADTDLFQLHSRAAISSHACWYS